MKWGCSPNPSSRHRFFLLTRSNQYPNQLKAAHGISITVLILVLSKVPCLLVVCASPPGCTVGTYCDIPELRIYFSCRFTYNWVRPRVTHIERPHDHFSSYSRVTIPTFAICKPHLNQCNGIMTGRVVIWLNETHTVQR